MRLGARLVVAGFALASMGVAVLGACSGSDSASPNGDSGDEFSLASYDAAYDGCATFSGNGTTCTAPLNYVCPPCDCVCAQGPDGLRWTCIIEDTSSCGPPLTNGDDDGATGGDDAPSAPETGTSDANGGVDTGGGGVLDASDGATGADADDAASE